MKVTLVSLALVLAAVPVGACGGSQPPVEAPEVPQAKPKPTATAHRLPPKAPDSPVASAVHISDEIRTACGISEPDALFAFDSANLRPEDSQVLDQLVRCFSTGPLAGKPKRLVGHADPRGSSDYNMTLGQSRADAVRQYVVGHGLDATKTESTSRGAMDATGTDEPTWTRDRRVDIML